MPERGLRIAISVYSEDRVKNYIAAMHALGACAQIVGEDFDAADFDGLLLPGGWDVDPALYGQQNRACQGVDRALDEMQRAALERFVQAGKPVLGICRGIQVINVCFGGTLVQHLPTSDRHSRDEGSDEDKVHATRALPGSFLEALYGAAFAVNSSHHQAVDAPGRGIEIVQWSDDGVAEALRHTALPVYGVQWHPERMCFDHRRADTVDGGALLRWFLERCAQAR